MILTYKHNNATLNPEINKKYENILPDDLSNINAISF